MVDVSLLIEPGYAVDNLLEIRQHRVLEILVGIKIQYQRSRGEAEKNRSLKNLPGLILGPGPIDHKSTSAVSCFWIPPIKK